MCGISGLINKNKHPVNESSLSLMNNLIRHRGPDGEGKYFGNHFAFGHRRLAILDLSSNAAQPMIADNGNVLTYNGEIYNYLELKQALKKLGHNFKSNSDTEVLLAAYNEWGNECVKKFNGMWAFAIYDKKKNIIFCSRDRFGIKPFYYTNSENIFAFGSEIKQLISHKCKNQANLQIILDYLVTGVEEHNNQSFFKEISKLPGGHNLIYYLDSNVLDIYEYYSISFSSPINSLNLEESISVYETCFQESISLRLRSDVKVGTCLSGGLDSSAVATIASNLYRSKSNYSFCAVHAQSSEKESDESRYAKIVSDHCHLDLHVIKPTSSDFISHIDNVIYAQEEPFGSPSVFMQYFVMRKAKEIDCKVMLDGQGGDETLLGYERYYPAYINSIPWLNRYKTYLDVNQNSKLSLLEIILYQYYFSNPKLRYRRLKHNCSFLRPDLWHHFNQDIIELLSKYSNNIMELQKLEISQTQLPHLLRYEDKNSMSHSVEARVPMIDYKLVETALSINNNFKIRDGWTKYILRRILASKLPEQIVWRRNKLGFNAPENSWLRAIKDTLDTDINNSTLLNHLVDSRKINIGSLNSRMIWRLFNLSRWEALFNVTM